MEFTKQIITYVVILFLVFMTSAMRAHTSSHKDADQDSSKAHASRSGQSELLLLNIYAGRSNVLGDFGSRDLSSQDAGLAKDGFSFGAAVTLKLTKRIGVKAKYHFQQNGLDGDLIEAGMGNAGSGNTYIVDAGSWIVRGIFGGLHFTTRVKTNSCLFIDADLMAGLPKCVLPPLKIRYQFGNRITEVLEQSASPTSAFAMMPSLGLHYNFKNPLTLNFNISYLMTKVTFGDVTTIYNGGTVLEKKTQQISTINAQLGLSWRIE